jgi:energy-coupling factor transporter ATP-binding protein EcfA2
VRLLHYVEIENFKLFGDKQRIELDHPAVIIGPNNCGKTSAIQALALWSQAVRTWYGIRGESKAKERPGVQLNRLEIVSVPVQKTRYFWSDMRVKKGSNENVYLIITVGVEFRGEVIPLAIRFHNDGDELVYCRVKEDSSYGSLENEEAKKDFLQYVIGIKVELLYPMSGLSTLEPVYQDKFIGTLMGQGRTAEVLRNLCYKVDGEEWAKIQALMRRLFQVELKSPTENPYGGIELYYSPVGLPKESLELATSGRGFQQMLLIFAYLYGHKKSVLLIDEPDAHLEILRQKQMYVLLRDIAADNDSQVIMVTHSEVILEEAVDRNLTLILDGKVEDLSSKANVENSLKVFGTENYVKARDMGYVLYVEGSTDVDMLRALAERLGHSVTEKLDDRLNSYYVQNNYPEVSLESELDRVGMGYGIPPREQFRNLRSLLPNLRGLAILDNDGRQRAESNEGGLTILYWRRYEAENYFITPGLLREFSLDHYGGETLFASVVQLDIESVLDELVLGAVFGGDKSDFDTWKDSPADSARLVWESKTERVKLSSFAEEFFRRLGTKLQRPMLLRKGELHRLVHLVDVKSIPNEVVQKLDALKALLTGP